MDTKIALFQRMKIRRTVHNDEWWFVITDIIAALTDSVNPSEYLKKLRLRDPSLAELFEKGGGTICPPPCPALRNGRRHPAHPRVEHRGDFPPHPIRSQPEGGAVQTVDGSRGV